MIHGRTFRTLLCGAALLAAAPALAAGPQWMPGFPMRMGTNVMLMWTPVPGASGYNVYKSDKAGALGPLLTSLPANNYMDPSVPMDKSAYYTVKVVTGGTEGDAGPVGALVAIKPLEAPKWTGHMEQDNNVVVRFDMVSGAAFYNVFRSDKKEGPFSLAASIQESKYTDTNVTPGNSYFYQVSAVDKNNVESPKSAVYEFKFEKKVETVAAKTYKQVDIIVKAGSALYGPDSRAYAQPTWLGLEGGNLVLDDLKGVIVVNPANDTVVREYEKPQGYEGEWGQRRSFGMLADGTMVATWYGGTMVRGFRSDGELAFEFSLEKPTEEEYAALNRLDDWKIDQQLTPTPLGVAEDGEGRLWITEPVFAQVHVVDRDGKLIKKIGEPRPRGDELKSVKSPGVIRFHKPTNRMYAIDGSVQTIRVFDVATLDYLKGADGNTIWGFRRAGAVPGAFQEPRGLCFTKEGNLVITDGIDGRIQVFDPELEYKGSLVYNAGDKKMEDAGGPIDCAIEGNSLFVAEPLNQKIARYDF